MEMETSEKSLEGMSCSSSHAVETAQKELSPSPAGELRWVFRKIDVALLSVLILSNVLNSMDRSNLGLAKVAGLEKDTGMSGSDFNVVASIMYPTYLLFMLPSNLVLRKVGARIWLSLLTVVWGVVNMSMAFATNRTHLIICRLFLGAAESGATPGALMLISLWYPRSMVTSRMAYFNSSFPIGAVIGGPIASGIMKISNERFRDWGWIFFIEGLVTAGYGLLMSCLLVNHPEESRIITPQEKELLEQQMKNQIADRHTAINKTQLLAHARDPLIYMQALLMFCTNFASSTTFTFGAIIVNQMGYSPSTSQALQAVPGICGFVGIICSRYYPTWFGSHYAGVLFCAFWTALASAILLSVTKKEVQIFALCCLSLGGIGLGGIGPGWLMSNVGGPTRSAVSSAVNIALGGVGALCASYTFRNKDQPRYLFGHGMNLFASLLSVVTASAAFATIRYRNKKKDTSRLEISHLTLQQQANLENDHPDFRYFQ